MQTPVFDVYLIIWGHFLGQQPRRWRQYMYNVADLWQRDVKKKKKKGEKGRTVTVLIKILIKDIDRVRVGI